LPEKYPDYQKANIPHLRLTKKEQVKLIGNAVPPEWARQIIAPVIERLQEVLIQKQAI
jgi:site-specific DNA-cytosine methylase